MVRKIFLIFLLGIFFIFIAINFRVQIAMSIIPILINFTNPIAVNENITWPDGPESNSQSINDRKPNIILILADDLGFNDVSLYNGGAGDGNLQTPNIDRIGKGGVTFTNGYAASASCSPSRASIMTGRYSTRFGFEFTPFYRFGYTLMKWMDPTFDPLKSQFKDASDENFLDEDYVGMPASEITIAEILKQEGYYNAHIGKWHLGGIKGQSPIEQGFDDSLQLLSPLYLPKNDPDVVNAKTSATIDKMVWASSQYAVRFNGGKAFEPGGYITDYYSKEAVKVIEKNKNRPFFLYLGHFAPHNPMQSLKNDFDHFHHLNNDDQHNLRVYSGMLRALDRGIGDILNALEQNNLTKNTLIIFSSDNGGANYLELSDINNPYRGWKLTHFEGGMHIPFMAKWPKKIKSGQIFDYPIHQNDILPTIATAAEAPIPTDRVIDGKNLFPYLKNNMPPHENLFWRQGRLQTVLQNQWKLIRDKNIDKKWLFNLKNDPTEKVNLALLNPSKVSELEALLDNHNLGQKEPNMESVIATPILIDKHTGQKYAEGDEYTYWDN